MDALLLAPGVGSKKYTLLVEPSSSKPTLMFKSSASISKELNKLPLGENKNTVSPPEEILKLV